jgi:hypothetical protein
MTCVGGLNERENDNDPELPERARRVSWTRWGSKKGGKLVFVVAAPIRG